MRALVVAPGPNYSVADVYRGWAEGLAAVGVETRLFELDKLLQWYSTAHQQDASGAWMQPYEQAEVAQRYKSLQADVTLRQHQLWYLRLAEAQAEQARVKVDAEAAALAMESRVADLRRIEADLEGFARDLRELLLSTPAAAPAPG